jgi:nucleoside-diphosphate-sugar epimerase
MRVFVTGATGFIGQHVCRRLLERGDEVLALVRDIRKLSRLPHEIGTLVGDLGIFADPQTRLPECDVVIHLAGVVSANQLEDYALVNHRAVEDLLACLARQEWSPKRFLFASSLAAAGPSPDDRPCNEADELAPIDAYGAAKAHAELAVRQAPFATTIFRPPIVFGPGDRATLTLFKAARASLGFRVAGRAQRLSFVDVRDLVEAIVLMAEDRRPQPSVYYVSHARPIDVHELWRELGHAVGCEVTVVPVPRWGLFAAMRASTLGARWFGYDNQLDAKQYAQLVASAFVCSSDLIRRELGWHARYDLAPALRHAADSYRRTAQLKPSR